MFAGKFERINSGCSILPGAGLEAVFAGGFPLLRARTHRERGHCSVADYVARASGPYSMPLTPRQIFNVSELMALKSSMIDGDHCARFQTRYCS
jgi:hypothetical protein